MLSYLKSIEKVTDKNIFSRGIKYYLEGGVAGYVELTLENWRRYRVIGTFEYSIKTPLLHLTLNPKKFQKAHTAILESVSCNCEYFLSHGICKHIVAVFASLEDEFNLEATSQKATKNRNNQSTQTVISSIFEAEKNRIIRSFTSEFENYMSVSKTWDFNWLEKFVIASSQDVEEYKEFLSDFQEKVKKTLEDFDNESKILILANKSLVFGTETWLNFWIQLTEYFSENNQINIWLVIYQIFKIGNFTDINDVVIKNLKNLEQSTKENLIKKLESLPDQYKGLVVDFAVDSSFSSWLLEKIDYLDPVNLVKLSLIEPDRQEAIEILLSNKLRTWSDFLTPDDYLELAKTLGFWQIKLGRSELFEQTLNYIETQHKRKKKFVAMLSKNLT